VFLLCFFCVFVFVTEFASVPAGRGGFPTCLVVFLLCFYCVFIVFSLVFRRLLAASGGVWRCLAVSGGFWRCLAVSDVFFLCVVCVFLVSDWFLADWRCLAVSDGF
jgi:hypothetical protein